MSADKPRLARTCWAASLGGCSKKISKEHIISSSAFDKYIEFATSRGPPKRIGAGSATVSILCTTHNSALTELDNEAASLIRAIQRYRVAKLDDLRLDRGAPQEVVIDVDGNQLERWAIKTFINATAASIGLGSDLLSPIELYGGHVVDYVFGKTSECKGAGLFWFNRGIQFDTRRSLRDVNICAAPVSSPIELTGADGVRKGMFSFPVYLYLGIGGVQFGVRANITTIGYDQWYQIATDISCGHALRYAQYRPAVIYCRPSDDNEITIQRFSHLKMRISWR